MAIMYSIIDNTIVDILNFTTEDDGTQRGYVSLTQSEEPKLGWSRVDENSDFTDARPYDEKRADAYPELGEQLDKLYHDIANGTLTTSGDFYTALNTVKTDYPKS